MGLWLSLLTRTFTSTGSASVPVELCSKFTCKLGRVAAPCDSAGSSHRAVASGNVMSCNASRPRAHGKNVATASAREKRTSKEPPVSFSGGTPSGSTNACEAPGAMQPLGPTAGAGGRATPSGPVTSTPLKSTGMEARDFSVNLRGVMDARGAATPGARSSKDACSAGTKRRLTPGTKTEVPVAPSPRLLRKQRLMDTDARQARPHLTTTGTTSGSSPAGNCRGNPSSRSAGSTRAEPLAG
mmetsp:Transcript_67844/g.219234  ORF Transcript_67844/g.219234 Transcript_67844/m.219234 type:complete len:241 (+) Transcript_67844:324-1046(+)